MPQLGHGRPPRLVERQARGGVLLRAAPVAALEAVAGPAGDRLELRVPAAKAAAIAAATCSLTRIVNARMDVTVSSRYRRPALRSASVAMGLPCLTPSSAPPPPGRATRSPCATAASRCPTTRSFPSSRATAPGPTSGAPRSTCSTRRCAKAYGGKRRDRLAGGPRRREGQEPARQLAARRDARGHRPAPGRHQGTAHHAGRRRHSARSTWRCASSSTSTPASGPVRWFTGVPSPVKQPERVDMVIFRENTEDIYAGIEYKAGHAEAAKRRSLPAGARWASQTIRFPETSAIGIKPVSRGGHEAAGPRGASTTRIAQRPEERDAGAQGQHHEVHRGRLPRLGLRAGQAGVRRRRDRRRAVVPAARTAS